jgi:hypothetical protein
LHSFGVGKTQKSFSIQDSGTDFFHFSRHLGYFENSKLEEKQVVWLDPVEFRL